MNPAVELHLTLILFLPWFAILSALYWLFPRAPRDAPRIAYDLVALALAVAAFLASVYWSIANADPSHGRLWPQVLATALGYGVFLAGLGVAYSIRAAWLRRRRS